MPDRALERLMEQARHYLELSRKAPSRLSDAEAVADHRGQLLEDLVALMEKALS